jgi:cystathionine beta-synthase
MGRADTQGRATRTQAHAKCDFLNLGGSVKDRIGIARVDAAERHGLLMLGGSAGTAILEERGLTNLRLRPRMEYRYHQGHQEQS